MKLAVGEYEPKGMLEENKNLLKIFRHFREEVFS